jgi:hypothetical protein
MSLLVNTNFIFIFIFFFLIRNIDANIIFIGCFFLISSLILIYFDLKKLTKSTIFIILTFISLFLFFDEKREIIEINSVFKISEKNENFYKDILGKQKYQILKQKYLNEYPECISDVFLCFQNDKLENKIVISPDQIPIFSNSDYSRKVSSINFKNLSDLRASFINTIDGRINPNFFHKFETPFFVKFENLDSISDICFRGFLIISDKQGNINLFEKNKYFCLENDQEIDEIIGLNLKSNQLSITSKSNELNKFNDEIMMLLFLLIILFAIEKQHFRQNLKLFLPVFISVSIIFFISKYDLWFGVFDLFTIYFFGFEGGDGLAYINFVNYLYQSFNQIDFVNFLRGGEDIFYYTPGFRYFLFFNQLIVGDFYYLYFFLIFTLPIVIHKLFKHQFGDNIGYLATISFLLLPIFHHIGISYYQYFRHVYRLYPEPIGYMFFMYALYLFFTQYKNKFLTMNLFFALSVFLRPNLVLTVVFIMLTKIIIEKTNIFSKKYFFYLLMISAIYLFPLIHNLYFGDSFTLFTLYGSNIFSFDNIISKDIYFYYEKLLNINFLLLILIFIPKINFYHKIICVSQYLTIFWFDENSRYYWMYWLSSIFLLFEFFKLTYLKRVNSKQILSKT